MKGSAIQELNNEYGVDNLDDLSNEDFDAGQSKLAQTETQKEPDFNIFNSISLEQSRDSGFGSFSNSIISETSCDQELSNEMSNHGRSIFIR